MCACVAGRSPHTVASMSHAEESLARLCGVAALSSHHSYDVRISCMAIVGERSLLNLGTLLKTVRAVGQDHCSCTHMDSCSHSLLW